MTINLTCSTKRTNFCINFNIGIASFAFNLFFFHYKFLFAVIIDMIIAEMKNVFNLIKQKIKSFIKEISSLTDSIQILNSTNIRRSLSGKQITDLVGKLTAEKLQIYITQLQAAKQASKGVFDAATVSTYANAIQGLEAKQAALLLSTQGLTNAQIAETLAVNESNVAKNYQAMADAGLLARKQKLTLAQVQENLQTVLGSEADVKAAMAAMGLSMATAEEGNQVVKLSAKKIQAAISSHKLTEAEAKELAMRTGVTLSIMTQAASTLPKWIAMLQAATKAIWGQIKATAVWMATNPIGWATAAIAAIGAVIAGLNKLAKAEKEASDKAQESYEKSKERTQSNKEEARSLDELIKKYEELKSVSDMDSDTRSEIKELQYDIMELVGGEVRNLDLVNGALNEQLAKLKEIAAEKARQNAEDAKDGYYQSRYAAEKLTGNNDDYGNDASISESELYELLDVTYDVSKGSYVDAKGKIVHWADILHTFTDQFGDIVRDSENIFSRDIVVDTNGITNIEDRIRRLEELKEHVGDMGLRKSVFYASITDSIAYYEDQYSNELEAVSILTESLIDNLYFSNEKLAGITVDSVDGFEQYRQTMISEMKNDETIGEAMAEGVLSDAAIEKAVNDFMATATQFSEWYEQWAGNVKGDTFNDKNPTFSTITSSIEQIATQLEPQFKKLGDAYKEIFTADGFTLDAVDNSILEDLRKTFTEIEEEIGVTFDTTQLENFFAVLSNNNSTAEQTQEAFNKIATSYLYSTDVLESLNSTTVDSIAKQLESLGITNASQLATEALAAKEEYLAFARREHTDEAGNLVNVTQDLANATADDINALIAEQDALEGEGIALDEATQKMIAYWMQKQAANGQLSTVGDIQQLSALCEGLGVSSKALRNYIYFKKLASMTDVYDVASIERFSANAEKNMEQAQADIQSIYDKLGGAEINFAVPDTSKKSKSEKDTTKEFDWIEQAIKNVEKEVTKLDNIVNSAYSTFSQKNEALAKEIGKVNEEIQLQQQAYDEYMRKADSIGLSDDYKTLIQNGEINIENISDKNLQEKISEYQQWYEKAVDASDAISELSTKVKDLHVAGYELQADRLEELLDNEAITEKRYLSEMDKLYKQYYENQTDYAVQAHEAKLALLNREKEYLNSVANAATSLLDKEINKVQDNAKEQQEPYEDQIKAAEKQIDAYEDQIKLFEKQIDAHNKQIDAYNKEIDLINDRKKPLQDELDALEDKAREENLILSLQEKQYNLKKAESQKDKLLYKDGQLIHTTDSTAIRDAKREVEDAELEIQKSDIQKQIDALDDEIEKYNELIDAINDQIDIIDDQIDAVNDQIDAVNECIDGLNDIVDQIGDAADAQVEALEKTENKWQEVIDQQEEAQNMLLLTGEFGADAIRKILAGDDDDLLAQWKENYITTLSEIDSETQGYIGDMTEQLAGLYNVDLSPLQAQFNNVKESISGMTDSLGSAVNTIIGKGVESAMGGNQDSAQSTMPAPNVQGGTANSLADAFTQVGNTANDVIGNPGAEGDGTVIGEFGSMKTAVGDVTDAISTGDGSLENAILEETETALDAFEQHTDKINNEVIPAIQSAANEMNAFNETADRDIEKTITIKYETVGSPASNVTTGAAHVEGTANVQGDWSVQTSEKHSLVGEVGRELIVRDGRFFTVGDNGAEMFPIKKGDIVFNHEQTEELLKNGHISGHGKAYADGTVGGGKVLLPDGQVLFRVPDDSPLFDLRRKAEAYMEKTGSKLEEVLKPVNAIQHHFEEIEKIIDNSTYNNIVNNNQPSIVLNGGINITCPGVRDPEVMRNLHRLIDDEFVGLRTAAYQQVMRSR